MYNNRLHRISSSERPFVPVESLCPLLDNRNVLLCGDHPKQRFRLEFPCLSVRTLRCVLYRREWLLAIWCCIACAIVLAGSGLWALHPNGGVTAVFRRAYPANHNQVPNRDSLARTRAFWVSASRASVRSCHQPKPQPKRAPPSSGPPHLESSNCQPSQTPRGPWRPKPHDESSRNHHRCMFPAAGYLTHPGAVIDASIQGFKSYAVRTVITGWYISHQIR